jgi:hypothetical protein
MKRSFETFGHRWKDNDKADLNRNTTSSFKLNSIVSGPAPMASFYAEVNEQ